MKRSKKVGYIVAVIALICFISLFVAIKINNNKINKQFSNVKYTSYEVKAGDTLWDIAKEYNKFDVSTDDYIAKICKINHVSRDFIRQGSTLVLILPMD